MDKESAQSQANWSQEQVAKNRLTGLYPPAGFMEKARPFIAQAISGKYCMVAVDIRHFRLFNKFHGREMGDRFLRYIADALQAMRKEHGGVAGYFEGDNFCLIMPYRTELIQSLWDKIMAGSTNQGSALGVLPVFGVSPIDDPELPPEVFHDRATLARSRAAARDPISYYSAGMESYLEEEMHLLMEVTEAWSRMNSPSSPSPSATSFPARWWERSRWCAGDTRTGG